MSGLNRVFARGRLLDVAAPILGVLFGTAGFSVVLLVTGHSPLAIWSDVLKGAFGSKSAVAETLVTTIPILLCALAVALPARAGLINIGAEGQLKAGAIGATWAALGFPALPSSLLLPLMTVCAVLCGGLWALVPGLLRAVAQANESVISLFMNFVASFLVLYLIHGPWKDPESHGWAQTTSFPDGALLPHLPETRLHILLVVGLALSLTLWAMMRWTSAGMALRLLDSNPRAATYAGIQSGPYLIYAMVGGGMMAALAGLGQVSAIQHRLREGISLDFGYTGFLVAWLCGNNFLVIPLGALLLGGLTVGADALRVTAGLPFATVQILQGMILMGVILFQAVMGRLKESILSQEMASHE